MNALTAAKMGINKPGHSSSGLSVAGEQYLLVLHYNNNGQEQDKEGETGILEEGS